MGRGLNSNSESVIGSSSSAGPSWSFIRAHSVCPSRQRDLGNGPISHRQPLARLLSLVSLHPARRELPRVAEIRVQTSCPVHPYPNKPLTWLQTLHPFFQLSRGSSQRPLALSLLSE